MAVSFVQSQASAVPATNSNIATSITTTAGNCLIAVVAAAAQTPSYYVASVRDSAGNYWQQVNTVITPSGTYPNEVLIAVWAAYNAASVTSVTATLANTTSKTGVAMRVIEVSGVTNVTPLDVQATAFTLSGTSLTPTATTTAAGDFAVAAVAVASANTVTHTADAWTTLAESSAAATWPVRLDAAYLVTSGAGAQSTTWTVSAASPIVGVIAAFKAGATVTTNPNPNWPQMTTKAAFGTKPNAGQVISYGTDISPYVRDSSISYGIPYELGQAEAGQNAITLYNQDGRFDPSSSSSPYWPSVVDYVPYQQQAVWSGITYPVATGYIERWPLEWDDSLTQISSVVGVDAVATLARVQLKSCVNHEVLLDSPWAYWPLNDASGSQFAANLATGPGQSVNLYPTPPRKAGSGTGDFGAQTLLAGDPSTGWGQATQDATNDQGWSLSTGVIPGSTVNALLNSNNLTTSSVSPWTAVNGTVTASSAQTRGGYSFSGLLTPTGGNSLAYVQSEMITISPGAQYSISGWLYSPTGWGNVSLSVNWFDANSGYLSTSSTIASIGSGAWTYFANTFTAPATAAKGQLVPTEGGTPAASNTLYLSNIILTPTVTFEAWAMFPLVPAKSNHTSIFTLKSSGVSWATHSIAAVTISQHGYYGTSGNVWVDTWDINGNKTSVDIGAHSYADGNWHHFALQLNAGSAALVIDGVTVYSASRTVSMTPIDVIEVGGAQDAWEATGIGIGTYAHVAAYNYAVQLPRLGAHFQSGHDAFPEDSGSRINRLLTYAGWTGPRALDTGSSVLAGCSTTLGQYATDAIADVALWEYGLAWVDGWGAFRFQSRSNRFNGTSMGTFGDGPGEYHYQADIKFDYDPTYQYNDVQITRQGPNGTQGIVQFSGDPNGTIPQYFTSTLQQALQLLSDTQAADRASFLYNLLSIPQLRIESITIDPSADPSLWPVALGAQIGQRYTVKRRSLGSTNAVISIDVIICQIKHEIKPGSWKTTFSTLPASTPTVNTSTGPWRLDDPTYSVLGTTTIPAF